MELGEWDLDRVTKELCYNYKFAAFYLDDYNFYANSKIIIDFFEKYNSIPNIKPLDFYKGSDIDDTFVFLAGNIELIYEKMRFESKIEYTGLGMKPNSKTIISRRKNNVFMGTESTEDIYFIINDVVRRILKKEEKNKIIKARHIKKIASTLNFTEYIKVNCGYINGEIVYYPVEEDKWNGYIKIDRNKEGINEKELVDIHMIDEIDNREVACGRYCKYVEKYNFSRLDDLYSIKAVEDGYAHYAFIDKKYKDITTSMNMKIEEYSDIIKISKA